MNLYETRVVVVDDAKDAAEALATALECDGYAVRTANDGAQALALVEAFDPHCVLLDIDMPGLSGLEVAAELRSRHGASLVIIAVTGWGRAEGRVTATFADFDHYLRKPVDASVLQKLLNPLT